jgi:endo-1,4-beta-xylanase
VSDVCWASVPVANDAPALFPLGTTTVTWTATDGSSNTSTAGQAVTVQDTAPPELAVVVSPTQLWPPNHKMVTIRAQVTATDACDGVPTVRLLSITSNEPDNGVGDGDTENDVQGAAFGTDDREFQLRAERSGNGSGRVYSIVYEATDSSGNRTTRTVLVTVPKSKG